MLSEGPSATATPVSRTVAGALGQACADVCYKNYPTSTQYCDSSALKALTSTAALQTALSGVSVAVRSPLLSACAYAGTPQVSVDGFASFRATDVATTCPDAYVSGASTTAQPDVCYTAPLPQARSICICTSDSTKQTPNPYRFGGLTVGEEEMQPTTEITLQPTSAAATKSSPLLALVLALVAAVSVKASRSTLLLLLAIAALYIAVTPAHAHNYIKTVHRAFEAAVSNPCQARIGNQPHIQVIKSVSFFGHTHTQQEEEEEEAHNSMSACAA